MTTMAAAVASEFVTRAYPNSCNKDWGCVLRDPDDADGMLQAVPRPSA